MSTIGEKTTRVRIERENGSVVDAHGTRTPLYVLRTVVWASEDALTAKEAVFAATLEHVLVTAWTIWFRTDLSILDRLIIGARLLSIHSYQDPNQSGRRVELRLLCSEVQS
jgi:head-tail adaptor